MSYYLYYHPLGKNGNGKMPSVVEGIEGAVTFMENSIDIYAMCEGKVTVGFQDDGTSYCYIENSHANNGETVTYFEYKYGDFSIENDTVVTKGQKIGVTSDKGSTGTQQIQINLTIDTNGTVYTGNATSGVWNGLYEINDKINQSTYLGWAASVGETESNIAYNYLIFAGQLITQTTAGGEDEWIYTQNWTNGIEGYFTHGGHTYSVYKQGQGPWASMSFGDGTVKSSGCSVTSMAIICSGFNNAITPSDTISSGINPSNARSQMSTGLSKYSITFTITQSASKETDKIKEHLQSGKVILTHVNGKYMANQSTSAGHFTTLLSYRSSDDSYFVGDCANINSPSDWVASSIIMPAIVNNGDWVCYIDGPY